MDSLASADLTRFSDSAVVELMQRLEVCKRRSAALDSRLLIEASDRSIPEHCGAGGCVRFLRETLNLSRFDASCRVRVAGQVGEFRDPTGHLRAPALPVAAQAFEAGEISRDHVRGIIEVINHLPDSVDADVRADTEQILVTYCRTGWPDDLPRIGRTILARLDPDGSLTTERDQKRLCGIEIGRQRLDGMSRISGWLTPQARAVWEPVLAKFARPGMCNGSDPASPGIAVGDNVDSHVLEAAARRDTRSAAQRNHDAFAALLGADIDAGKLGSHRRLPVELILTMSVTDLEQGAGVATTATGGDLSIAQALKLAGNTRPLLAVLDSAGMPLYLGRSPRLASPAQRLALIASERGCTRPGCDSPASMCAVHHVTDWAKGGPTDLNNLTLACDHCHALVNDSPNGWKTVKLGKNSPYPGRTGWIAPRHMDPTGTPRVNHRHHAAEQIAQSLARSRTRRAQLAYQARISHRAPE